MDGRAGDAPRARCGGRPQRSEQRRLGRSAHRSRGRDLGLGRAGVRRRATAAVDTGCVDPRLDRSEASVRAGLHEGAHDVVPQPGDAVEPRPHDGQHPLLPVSGPSGRLRGHRGGDRLAGGHRRPGGAALPARRLLRGEPRPAARRSRRGVAAAAVDPDRADGRRRADGRARRPDPTGDRRACPHVVAAGPRVARGAARLAQARAADRRQHRDRAAVRGRTRAVRARARLRDPAGRPARDQHERVAARELHPRPGRDRCRRVRAHARADGCRDDPGARARGGAALPHLDLLPAARLGLLRDALAAATTGISDGPPGRRAARARAAGRRTRRGDAAPARLDRHALRARRP